MNQQPNQRHDLPYYLGCPGWADEGLVDTFYSTRNRRRWIGQYSSVFNAVEANNTFYGLPKLDTAKTWASSVWEGGDSADGGIPNSFQFVFKFPSAISHEKQLRNAGRETAEFLDLLNLFREADCLGPAFLQLPPFFAGRQLPDLANYLQQLPTGFHYSVETRHADYFDQGPIEREFTELLTQLKIDRMLLDSRPLFSAPATDNWETISQQRKPQSPVRQTVTASRPVLRLINRNDVPTAKPWMEQWAKIVAGWIDQGLIPYIFTHAPDNRFAPLAAEQFHACLTKHIPSLSPLPEWPARIVQQQQPLF
ncbi:MAG: DUF72 domain-containing protein [Bythopirellula sp.]